MLKQYAYIEWLSFELPQVDPAVNDELANDSDMEDINPFSASQYRWLLSNGDVDLQQAITGSSNELLAWLPSTVAANNTDIVFVIPGAKVAVQQVPYHEREKRHFIKMLPYAVEDSVIDDVDDLHFAVGQKTESQATIAYVNQQWFEQALAFFEANGQSVARSVIDFQCLQRADNTSTLWFNGDQVIANSHTGSGFSTNTSLANNFLRGLLNSSLPNKMTEESKEDSVDKIALSGNPSDNDIAYNVYVADVEPAPSIEQAESTPLKTPYSVEQVTRTFHTLAPEIHSEFHTQLPPLSLNNPHMINFCSGDYAPKKKSSGRGISWSLVGGVGLITILLFFVSNGLDIYLTQQKIAAQEQKIESLVRQVIPEGVIRDPIRSLTNKLDDVAGSGEQASQVVRMLSNVAPVVQSLDIELLTINYKHKEKTLRLSVQANTFNIVEQLRESIEAKGLRAELLSSNAIDNKFQARLRIFQENQ
ncbi:type II secretion system protein GspL [Eionea flava]